MSVLRAMAKRMQPTSSTSGTAAELLQRGICGTLYMERCGGFGRHRDLEMIQYQVMSVLDFMQAGQPATGWLFLQSAWTRLFWTMANSTCSPSDVAGGPSQHHLCEPPTELAFSLSGFHALGRSEVGDGGLAFIKEIDVIITKRQEITSASPAALRSQTEGVVGAKPKPNQRRRMEEERVQAQGAKMGRRIESRQYPTVNGFYKF